MIWWIRLGWRLRRIRPEMEKLTHMKFSVNWMIQLISVVGHAAAQAIDVLPGKAKLWASVTLAAAQGLTAVLAHFANPDGTPVELPYQPKQRD